MDPESSSITIEIADRPGLVALWGEDEVSKFESLLLESKIERGGNHVIKYYDPPKPKPVFEGVDEESDEELEFDDVGVDHPSFEYEDDDKDTLNVEEINKSNKWDRADYSVFVSRPLTAMTQRYTCIWSGGDDSFTDKLVGFMWVAVHGLNSICVATRIHDLNDECNHRMLMSRQHPILSHRVFQKGLIGKVEGFVDRNRVPRHHLHQIMKKPFGVVSLISSTTDVHQETGDDAIEASGAVVYLKEKLESGLVFDRNKTIQTAISALQHQCNQEFSADDIWVSVVHEGVDMCLQRREVKEYLASINKTKPFED